MTSRWAALAVALAVAALAVAAPAWAADSKKTDAQKDPPGLIHMSPEQQKTIDLKAVIADREAISEPLRLPGTVAFDAGHVAILRALGQARVVRLLVQPGDVVAAGQGVVEVEMPMLVQLQQDLAAARAGLRETEAGVAVTRAALDRAVILARDGSLARAEADRRRLVLAQAVAAEQTNRAKVATFETQISRLNPVAGSGLAALRTPIDGIVISSNITPGEVIDTASEAITVADLHTVLVMAQIPESDAAKVGVSDPARVTIAGNANRAWDGRVATLGAQLNPQSRTLPARIVIANPDSRSVPACMSTSSSRAC